MAEDGPESGFERHRRAWLQLSYRERLEWLEQEKRFAARALEAARARWGSRAPMDAPTGRKT
jgi:hypothetical protein